MRWCAVSHPPARVHSSWRRLESSTSNTPCTLGRRNLRRDQRVRDRKACREGRMERRAGRHEQQNKECRLIHGSNACRRTNACTGNPHQADHSRHSTHQQRRSPARPPNSPSRRLT